MRITLIHNPDAGEEHVTGTQLCDAVRAAGHEPVYASTKGADWQAAVQEADDLVVAAGGDGTIAKVGRELQHRDVPLALLPFGTANNIAVSLGVGGDWRQLVRGLDRGTAVPFDVGVATGSWGERSFLEGVGFGFVARAISDAYAASTAVAGTLGRDVQLATDLARVQQVLSRSTPAPYRLSTDDGDIETEAVLVAIMNIPSVGPRLALAPTARPDDGLLHLVIAREADRRKLERYLEARLEGEYPHLELEEHVAREVRVETACPLLHVDDRLEDAEAAVVSARLVPGALRILIPEHAAHGVPTA
jgi:diacylglycerol kinase (ATP)